MKKTVKSITKHINNTSMISMRITTTPKQVAKIGDPKEMIELNMPLILANKEGSISLTNMILIEFEMIEIPIIPINVPKTTNKTLTTLSRKKDVPTHKR